MLEKAKEKLVWWLNFGQDANSHWLTFLSSLKYVAE